MRAVRRACSWAVALTSVIPSLPQTAHACGGGIVSPDTIRVAADTQRIFLSVRKDRTDVITQIVVPETSADYGVLLPVPVEPTVDPEPVSSDELDTLDGATAPLVFVESDDGGGGGCGCPFAGGSDASKDGAGGPDGVRVSEPVEIGPVTAVALTADAGDAINDWLADNGFVIPTEAQALVAEYSGSGRWFIAIRRSETAGLDGPTSIGVHFSMAGDRRLLPLRFARLGAAETVAFTVFVAASEASAPAPPFEALTLPDLDEATFESSGYATAISEGVRAHGDRAFVIEGVHTAEDVIDAGSQIGALVEPSQKITRLTTILPASSLDTDVTLDEPFSGDAPNTWFVGLAPGDSTAYLATSIALAGVLFRRRRRGG